jgi:C_GCAxxG_C_C family probable redox protein
MNLSRPDVRRSAEDAFSSGFYCAESVVVAIAKAQGIQSELLPRIATALCSGMARSCGPCGALTGAIVAIGMVLGRDTETDSVQPAYDATRRLIQEFEQEFGSRDCQPLLDGCDLATPEGQAMFREQGFRELCLRFTGQAAEIAARIIAEQKG